MSGKSHSALQLAVYGDVPIQIGQNAHYDPCPPPEVPTIGMSACQTPKVSDLNQIAHDKESAVNVLVLDPTGHLHRSYRVQVTAVLSA